MLQKFPEKFPVFVSSCYPWLHPVFADFCATKRGTGAAFGEQLIEYTKQQNTIKSNIGRTFFHKVFCTSVLSFLIINKNSILLSTKDYGTLATQMSKIVAGNRVQPAPLCALRPVCPVANHVLPFFAPR